MPAELVITGFGAVGSFGDSPSALLDALRAGEPLSWPGQRLGAQVRSAEIRDFDLARFRRTAKGHRAPRVSQYALAAAAQAIAAAGIDDRRVARDDVAIVYGTGNGPGEVVAKNLAAITGDGLGAIEPLAFQESVFNAPASLVSIEYGFRGPLLALPMGWAAGACAISVAADLIAAGHASLALVVASDEVSALAHDAMAALGLVRGAAAGTGLPGRRPIPFFSSEGGAAIVIEARAHAAQRGATPLLELAGHGLASDAFGVGPKGLGPAALSQAMQRALGDASQRRPALLYAGSYGSDDAEHAESDAIAQVFGAARPPRAINLRRVTGEAKAPMALFSLIAATAALAAPGDAALCNAFWVNGTNASVLVRRPQ